MADLKLPFFILNLKVKTETVLQCVWNIFLIDVIPHYLPLCDPPPMPAMNHVSFAVILTCYNFFLFLPFNLDFLFYSSSQSWKEKTTFQTCISVFLTYFSISLPLFPLSLLLLFFSVSFLSPCVIFLGTYGPWHCHTHKFLSLFVFLLCVCFFFLSHFIAMIITQNTLLWIFIYCWSITSATLGCQCVTCSLAALLLSVLTVLWLP